MKKTSEKSKYFLIISVSFWVLVLPTYLSFSTLDGLDALSFYTCIEDIDQEDSSPSSEKEELNLILSFCIKLTQMAHLPSVRIQNRSCQLPSLYSQSLILRC
jgi:hypothetical protein